MYDTQLRLQIHNFCRSEIADQWTSVVNIMEDTNPTTSRESDFTSLSLSLKAIGNDLPAIIYLKAFQRKFIMLLFFP